MTRTALSGVRLLDGEKPAVDDQTVVVSGNQIEAIEPTASFSASGDIVVYDLSGKTLMPGMVQAHWHGSYKDLDFEPSPVGVT